MRAVVYFYGPKTAWANRIDETEIVASKTVPSKYVGRWWALSIVSQMNQARVGWAVIDDAGEAIEHRPPTGQLAA